MSFWWVCACIIWMLNQKNMFTWLRKAKARTPIMVSFVFFNLWNFKNLQTSPVSGILEDVHHVQLPTLPFFPWAGQPVLGGLGGASPSNWTASSPEDRISTYQVYTWDFPGFLRGLLSGYLWCSLIFQFLKDESDEPSINPIAVLMFARVPGFWPKHSENRWNWEGNHPPYPL